MAIDKTPKLAALTAFGIGGWLLPLAYPLSTPVTSFSLMLSAFSSTALALEVQRESLVSSVANTEKKLDLERLAYEQSLRHQRELDNLRELYGFGDDEDDRYQDSQPALTGATIHQGAIGASPPLSDRPEQFDLDWLLRSNSQHLLVTGPTGAGKTTFVKWVATQFSAKQGKVYDPDFDGSDWGFPVVEAPMEDYSSIRGNMRVDLNEFEKRKPNDPANPKTVLIVEEMPSTIPECAEDGEKWLKLLLRRGRKRNLFVIGVSQDRNADTFKLKSAAVLQNFTVLYLGGYAHDALDRIRNRQEREAIRQTLNSCDRPALVQFNGRFYPWNVPSLNGSPTPPAQTRQACQGELVEGNPIAILDRTLAASPTPETMHLQILDMARGSKDGIISVRDVMRALSIPTAQEVKDLFYQLQSLELGEIQSDRLPNGNERITFFAYPPMP
jgi:energy-coupling factor transporter ATP-binding protein EcfA2